MSEEAQKGPWWGTYDLEIGAAAMWEIGPLRVWLRRNHAEWRLAHEWLDDDRVDWGFDGDADWPGEECTTERFVVSETTGGAHLRPLPADRAVVARPRSSVRVLPGQSARIFMSSPLWVEILVGRSPTSLRELAAKRLSDTWFGATTRRGELSYALRTNARTELAELPRAQYRVLTPVVIQNEAEAPLLVERLSLPVPFLSVYGAQDGTAWTEEVRMVSREGGDNAELDVRSGPPEEARGSERLGEPREVPREGHLFRAFGSLLGIEL